VKIYEFKKMDHKLLCEYLNWIDTITTDIDTKREKIQHVIDKISFSLGKHIKAKK